MFDHGSWVMTHDTSKMIDQLESVRKKIVAINHAMEKIYFRKTLNWIDQWLFTTLNDSI